MELFETQNSDSSFFHSLHAKLALNIHFCYYNSLMREKQTETDDRVKLKPFLGIRPGVYLTAIYSVILLGILFLLLVYPGLKNPGAVLRINAEPRGAAIRVDGVYMGTSTDKIFAPKGERVLEAVLPGFETESVTAQIPGRVFGSLFFPRSYSVSFTLKTNNAATVLAQAAGDYAAWSFGGEPTAAWQIPLDLSEGAYRAGQNDPSYTEILTAAARFAVTRAALRDLVRAKILLDSAGLSPSPAGLIHSASDILSFLSENSGSAQWLSGILPPESAAIVKTSAWYKNETVYPAHIRADRLEGARRLTLAGITFIGIDGFMISEYPVPRSLFETFLNENPSWREQNDGDTAQIFSVFPERGNEVTGVSWFTAEAFCQWLSKRLPPSMSGMEVRLPTESEWETAVLSGAINTENSVFEWCADPFAPLQFIKVSAKAMQAVGSPERTLRGLSSKTPENRASMPPGFSSPFVTFRAVIAEKDSE
jgi:hypothetical protein